jgi:hypothetical protein
MQLSPALRLRLRTAHRRRAFSGARVAADAFVWIVGLGALFGVLAGGLLTLR